MICELTCFRGPSYETFVGFVGISRVSDRYVRAPGFVAHTSCQQLQLLRAETGEEAAWRARRHEPSQSCNSTGFWGYMGKSGNGKAHGSYPIIQGPATLGLRA